MSKILHKALLSMTPGVDMREVLIKSSVLALSSAIFTIPYFHYMIFVVLAQERFAENLRCWRFFWSELFLLFVLCFLSAMVGLCLYKKYKLPGFGDVKQFTGSIPHLLTIGAVMITASYFLFDRYFIEISPLSYPTDGMHLISLPLQGAFTDEIILRLCLVTIAVGIFKNKRIGVVFVSFLATLFTVKYFHFFGIKLDLNYLFVTQLVLSFFSNLILGYLFVTRGLIYSMSLKFLFGMKYVVVSILY